MTIRQVISPYDNLWHGCVAVPAAGEGVCATCHAATRPGRARCPTCRRTQGQVSRPAPVVVPITLFRTGDPVWHLLRRYKDGWTPAERRRLRRRLARMLSAFLRGHLACVAPDAGAGWLIATVPPTHRRPGGNPLERALLSSIGLGWRYRRVLKTREAPRHNEASDGAFTVTRPVAGQRFILIDDTLTTGASVHSAASALQLAGATVLAAVVVGRVVNPQAAPQEAALWRAATGTPFAPGRCCRCPPKTAPRVGLRAVHDLLQAP